jgi:PBSX family phage portal protein
MQSRVKKVARSAFETRAEETTRSPVVKAIVIGNDGRTRELSNTIDEETVRRAFMEMGALIPPYNPSTLCEIFECSAALRPSVDAYAVNIDGNGHHLEPMVDLDGDDLIEQIASAIYIERLAARDAGQVVPHVVPTPEEVQERLSRIEDAMRVERFKLEQFFETCTVDESFIALRKKTRQDLEVTGNGFWEVLRNKAGQVVQFEYVQSQTMRLLAQGREFVDIDVPVRVSPISVRHETLKRRFRKFVQVIDQVKVYFKEFGDPRVMSSATGVYYRTVLELQTKEQATGPGRTVAEPATEIMHFRIHAPRSPYGVPRWIGAMLSVLGMRQADEVNYLYFENKSVPPLALLVSGGRVNADSVQMIKDFVENEVKGMRNFHKILVIEAEPAQGNEGDPLGAGRMKIELKPLTQAQQSDALFQKYDERGLDKVGMQFRLSRMLRGDIRDFNRATADAALEFAEAQVFGPERVEFDYFVNRVVLGSLGIRFWRFASNATIVRDPKVLAEIIARLTSANVLVPADGRRLAAELVFASPLPKIDADWVNQPVMLTQVGVPLDGTMDGKIPGLDESTAPAGPGRGAAQPQGAAPAKAEVQKPLTRAERVLAWARGVQQTSTRRKELTTLATQILGLRDELVKLDEERSSAEHVAAVRAGDETTSTPPQVAPAPAAPPLEEERITMPLDELVRRFHITPTPAP